MLYTLKNDILTVTLSSLGAEIRSVKRGGCEYIWQGDPAFWSGQCPVVFPICGRFFGGKYICEGKEYELGTHGFARSSEFDVKADGTKVVFTLSANEKTRACYPFEFLFTLTYELVGEKLTVKADIKNTGDKLLPATYGAHPGFNVPLDNGAFDDYYLEFSEFCTPNELVCSTTCFNTGIKKPFPIENGRRLPLSHNLFAIDSVFMDRVAPSVTLKSPKSQRSVTLNYADLPYLGIWHMPRTEAPYLCIEPWCGLPSFDGAVEDISTKNDMFHIPSGETKTITYEIIFG